MKILTISPNTKNNIINNIISSNTDSYIFNSSNYLSFIESFNDELDELLNDKNSFIKYIDMINPNIDINDRMIKEINNINNDLVLNTDKLYLSTTIYINNNYNYVLYYNNIYYDLIKNNIINENDINKIYLNLLSTYIKYDYNIKNEILLGDIYILKYDKNHKLFEINEKEIYEIIFNNIFFTYYSGYCNNIVLGNKMRYKSIIHNETDKNEKYEILSNKKLVKFTKDNVITIFKYNIFFNDFIEKKLSNIYIEYTDKYNLLISNSLNYCFSWCNLEKNDIIDII